MATAGYDYLLSGYKWSDPSHVTFSFAPDGVMWDHGTNNLNATFNARFGSGVWEAQIARALATWESVANINIAQTHDSYLDFGTYGQPQGDPRFGDIRFGGYAFNDPTTLAQSYFPPPQGTTEAGDVDINTAMPWHIGSDYDLFSVMLHETGLTLGLNEPPSTSVVMSTNYHGVLTGLTPADIQGIQAIYGPRTLDGYQAQGQGLSPASAIDVTGQLGSSAQATIGGVSLASIGATEYFSVVAPNVPGARLQVTAAAGGVSMLSPRVTLYDGSGQVLGTQGDPGVWGANVTVGDSQVVPGERYLIAVTGATSDVFGVGAYHLNVAFTGGTPVATPPPSPSPPAGPVAPVVPPSAPLPVTVPSVAPDRFEPNDTFSQATNAGLVRSSAALTGLSLTTSSDVDDFVFVGVRPGVYQVSAPGTVVRIFDASGQLVGWGQGQASVWVARRRSALFVQVSAPGTTPVANYALSIQAPPAWSVPVHVARPRGHAVPHWAGRRSRWHR